MNHFTKKIKKYFSSESLKSFTFCVKLGDLLFSPFSFPLSQFDIKGISFFMESQII